MKLKYERYLDFGVFYIRGPIDIKSIRLLLVGLEQIVRELEGNIMIHLGNAIIPLQELRVLAEIKKKLKPKTKHELIWICKDRSLADYGGPELYFTRFTSSKMKVVAQRVLIDDAVYLMQESNAALQQKIIDLSGSAEDMDKVIIENDMLRGQSGVLSRMNGWLATRGAMLELMPSEDSEIQIRIDEAKILLSNLTNGEVEL